MTTISRTDNSIWRKRSFRVSLVLVLVLGAALAWLVYMNAATTPPTDLVRNPRTLAALQLPDVQAFVPAQHAGDASSLYRKAIDLCLADRERYERFVDSGSWQEFGSSKFPALAPLVDAAQLQEAKIFSAVPQDVIGYARSKPKLDAAAILGRLCAERLGLLALKHNDLASAERYFNAAAALGQKLVAERLTYDEFETGWSIVGSSLQGLAMLADARHDDARAQAIRALNNERLNYFRDHITPMLHILRSVDPNVVGQHAGDVRVLATECKDEMWKIEATLALGRMRFFVGTGASSDQRAASRLLNKLASAPDPAQSFAARAALELTAEQFRSQ